MVWFRKKKKLWKNNLDRSEKWKTNGFIERTILLKDCSERKQTKQIENERSFWERTKAFFKRLMDERTRLNSTWDAISNYYYLYILLNKKKLRILLKRRPWKQLEKNWKLKKGVQTLLHMFVLLYRYCLYFRISTSTLHIYLGIDCQDLDI